VSTASRSPGMRTALIGVVGVLMLLVLAGLLLVPRSSRATPALSGDVLPGKVAPPFRLQDQFGRQVTLSGFRGRPVILTFLRSHCRETCPLIAEELRRALRDLGAAGRSLALLVVSTDPEGDTPSAVRSFSRAHGLLHRWHFLTGTRQGLTDAWRAYHIYAPPLAADATLEDRHTSATYLIDREGRQRVLWTGGLDTAAISRDVRIILGFPVSITLKDADPAPEVGHPAPDFTLTSVHGGELSLADFRGKVVLLNFWATWCIPCRTEMPRLATWYREERQHELVVLGIDKQEPRADVLNLLRTLHISYPIGLDETGSVASRYGANVLPVSFLIDRHGTVQSVRIGIVDSVYFVTQVQPLLDTR